eukprot:2811578-Amphidinium_carterae.1
MWCFLSAPDVIQRGHIAPARCGVRWCVSIKFCLVLPKACLGGRYVHVTCDGTSWALWAAQQHSARSVCLQTSKMMPRATH